MREREREMMCMYKFNYHRNSKAVALIPLETIMLKLPAPC